MTDDDTPAPEAGTIDDAQPANCREELAAVLRARDTLAAVDTDALDLLGCCVGHLGDLLGEFRGGDRVLVR